MIDDPDVGLSYAGLGGAVACCLGLELLGGVAVVGGLGAALGLTVDLAYGGIVVLGGILAVLAAVGYRQISTGQNPAENSS